MVRTRLRKQRAARSSSTTLQCAACSIRDEKKLTAAPPFFPLLQWNVMQYPSRGTRTDHRREVVHTAAAAVRRTPAAAVVRTAAAAKAEERSATAGEQPRRREEEEERLLRQLERRRVYQRDPFLFLLYGCLTVDCVCLMERLLEVRPAKAFRQ